MKGQKNRYIPKIKYDGKIFNFCGSLIFAAERAINRRHLEHALIFRVNITNMMYIFFHFITNIRERKAKQTSNKHKTEKFLLECTSGLWGTID